MSAAAEQILATLEARGLRVKMRDDGRLALVGPPGTLPLRTDALVRAMREYRAELVQRLGLVEPKRERWTMPQLPGAPVDEWLCLDGAVIPAAGSLPPNALYSRRAGELGWTLIQRLTQASF